jgi:hypothetical protein
MASTLAVGPLAQAKELPHRQLAAERSTTTERIIRNGSRTTTDSEIRMLRTERDQKVRQLHKEYKKRMDRLKHEQSIRDRLSDQ